MLKEGKYQAWLMMVASILVLGACGSDEKASNQKNVPAAEDSIPADDPVGEPREPIAPICQNVIFDTLGPGLLSHEFRQSDVTCIDLLFSKFVTIKIPHSFKTVISPTELSSIGSAHYPKVLMTANSGFECVFQSERRYDYFDEVFFLTRAQFEECRDSSGELLDVEPGDSLFVGLGLKFEYVQSRMEVNSSIETKLKFKITGAIGAIQPPLIPVPPIHGGPI